MRTVLPSWTICSGIRFTIRRRMSLRMATCHHLQTVLTPNAYRLLHPTVAVLMAIDHLHHLMVCIQVGRHHLRPTEKAVLPTSQTICVVLTLHLRMIWMTTV